MSDTISITQINPIVGSFKQNLQMIKDAIQTAKNDNADVIVFPELAVNNRAFGKDRRYTITSHYRWNLT